MFSDDDWDELELEPPVERPKTEPLAEARLDEPPGAKVAESYLREADEERQWATRREPPPPPKRPLVDGVYGYPFRGQALATALLMSVALLAASMAALGAYLSPLFFWLSILLIGAICVGVAAYLSANYVAIVETTATGFDEVEDWPESGFAMLPITLGPSLYAAGIGFTAGQVLAWPLPLTAAAGWLLFFPLFQLSVFQDASPLLPLSWEVFATLLPHRKAWLKYYAGTLALAALLLVVGLVAWSDPPYVAVALLSLATGFCVSIHARLLGRLAWVIQQKEIEN
jgi:hypothetical protein